MSERGFWWHAWPYAIASVLTSAGAVTGVVATDGDPKAIGAGGGAVVALAYILWRRFGGQK